MLAGTLPEPTTELESLVDRWNMLVVDDWPRMTRLDEHEVARLRQAAAAQLDRHFEALSRPGRSATVWQAAEAAIETLFVADQGFWTDKQKVMIHQTLRSANLSGHEALPGSPELPGDPESSRPAFCEEALDALVYDGSPQGGAGPEGSSRLMTSAIGVPSGELIRIGAVVVLAAA